MFLKTIKFGYSRKSCLSYFDVPSRHLALKYFKNILALFCLIRLKVSILIQVEIYCIKVEFVLHNIGLVNIMAIRPSFWIKYSCKLHFLNSSYPVRQIMI